MSQDTRRPDSIDQLMKRIRLSHMRRASQQYQHASEFCEKIVGYYADIADDETDLIETAAKRIKRDFSRLHDQYQSEVRRLADVIDAVERGDEDA